MKGLFQRTRPALLLLPNRGMASDTWGRSSLMMLWNTVSESRIVTSEKQQETNLVILFQNSEVWDVNMPF